MWSQSMLSFGGLDDKIDQVPIYSWVITNIMHTNAFIIVTIRLIWLV